MLWIRGSGACARAFEGLFRSRSMIPRSRQPNDFDYSSDADRGFEEFDTEWSPSAEAEGDLFVLADHRDETGTGGGQFVREGGHLSPDDYSVEELDVARDLYDLFPLEQEQLPPRFVETITSHASSWETNTSLQQRVTYRVFQRLH